MKTKSTKNRMLTTFRLAVLLCFVFLSSASWAQTIAAWQFGTPASAGDEEVQVATMYNPHIMPPELTRGDGVQAYSLPRGFSSINWMISGTDNYGSAVSNNNYYEFTIQSEAHYQVSISSIAARLRRSANGPSRYQWAYNVNNAGFVQIGSSYSTLADAVDEGELVTTLNTASIADLQNTSAYAIPIVIRLYAWYALEETGTFAFGRTPVGTSTNSLAINGTVTPVIAKPIPSTLSASSTNDASNIQSTSAIVYGQITDLGYPKATHHGFCWSTTPISDTAPLPTNKVDFGEPDSFNEYMATLDNLTPNTTYYYSAYAINSSGIKYGRILSFKTTAATTPNDIAINFTGNGSSSSVGSVTIENLTTGETKSISGDAVLYLNPSAKVPSITTNMENVSEKSIEKMTVYPNPAIASSTLSFGLTEKGNVRVNICDISGKVISNYFDYLTAGSYKFQLPALQSGIYFVTLVENGNKRTQKLVSVNSTSGDISPIQNIEKTELAETISDRPQKVSAAVVANEGMIFNLGNQLRFTASSGRSKTIIMDSPTKSKTMDVRFIECIDGDDNAYPVVQVGSLYWMAENLKTTKKTDGSALTKATGAAWAALTSASDAYCYYGDVDANAANYGALYTYHAANTALAPTGGWRLPTKMECIKLASYLEGKERAGVKLKEVGTANWTADNIYATNQSGFRALPAGMRVGTTFSATGTTAAFWTSTASANKTEAAIAKLTSSQDSISVYTDTVQTAGLSVRYVFEVPDPKPKQMMDVFGTDSTKINYNEKLPLPKNTVLMAPDKELFFTGRHDTSLSPQLRFMDNPTATSAPFIAGLPTIASGAVKWWENPKKVTTMVNENGRENTVIAVWNEAEAGAISGYKNITLHIIGDESTNYAHQAIVLPDKFWMPAIVSGTAYNGQTMNAYDIQEAWQWEMTVRSGDINNDGTPDILLAVHDTLRIYDGKTFTRLSQRGFYEDFNQSKNFAFFLRTEVADVDEDGKNDVVVMTSTPKSFELSKTNDSKCATLHLFLNGDIQQSDPAVYKTKKLANAFTGTEFRGYSTPEYARTANFTIGDINNDGHPEIVIVCSFSYNTPPAIDNGMSVLTYVTYNATTDPTKSVFTFSPARICAGWVDYSLLKDIVLAKLKGPSGSNYIIQSELIYYVDASGVINGNYGPNGEQNLVITTGNYGKNIVYGDQMIVGNFDKDPSGREMIYYMVNIRDVPWAVANTNTLSINSSALNQTTGEVISYTNPVPFFSENSGNLQSKNHFPVIAAVNTRHTGRVLQFQRHEFMLTKPKLIAAMAAAPYFEGFYDTNFSPRTIWSKSTMSGSGKDTASTHTATAIVGFEHKFEVPFIGTQIGGIEFTAKAAMSFSKNYSGTSSKTMTVGFSGAKEDMAVVTSTPYDAFFYKVLKSENPDEINTEVMFGFPRKTITQLVTVENYNKMVEGQNAPKIDKSIFRHTPGNPFSYPNGSTSKLSNLPWTSSKECQTEFVGVGQGSTKASIGKENTNTTTTGFSQDYEFELIASVGDFKLGGGYGYNKEKTESTTVGSGTQVECEVPGLLNFSDSSKKFNWSMKWYNYQKAGYKFQVINYVVTTNQ
ncbi:MAG: FISUMP domain-containing protein [Paludibacter sp.]